MGIFYQIKTTIIFPLRETDSRLRTGVSAG